MSVRHTILLKLTGASLVDRAGNISADTIRAIGRQIAALAPSHTFGIVIGGGNLFRGSQQGKSLGLTQARAHEIGMLATVMNALIIHDIFSQLGIESVVLSAIACPQIADQISSESIRQNIQQGKTIIFAGGTGNPFLTTDTCAILRALQIEATQVWKGTTVDGIYNQDPAYAQHAHKIDRISYDEIISKRLGIMDITAYCLAREHAMPIRVFNIFEKNILIDCAHNQAIGSIIDKE
jgi:uridylate kinase